MSDSTEQSSGETSGAREPKPRVQTTKSTMVQKLLRRAKGATLVEITSATQWQPHSARAFLTGLRKKGLVLVKECRTDGETSWRIDG